jgi:hypothetical protein
MMLIMARDFQYIYTNITKITTSLQKDYNYNQIDGYFAWPTSFISVCNLIWKMIWGSDWHVTISYRDVKIIILNFILFKYICTLIYKQYENNEKSNNEIYQLAKDQALVKKLKNKRFRPFCLCPPDVMFVTRGSKNSLFFVFESLSNLVYIYISKRLKK